MIAASVVLKGLGDLALDVVGQPVGLFGWDLGRPGTLGAVHLGQSVQDPARHTDAHAPQYGLQSANLLATFREDAVTKVMTVLTLRWGLRFLCR